MEYKYLVLISSNNHLEADKLASQVNVKDVVQLDKVYAKVDDVSTFEISWQNGLDAIQEREAYYNDLNQVFMGLIETFQRQGIIKEDGKFDIENYTTASVVHFATKMATLGIKLVNEKADKINAEIKEAKTCLKRMKTPMGLTLNQEGVEYYESILESHSEPPFKIGATMALPIQMILNALNASFNDGGREINFDFDKMMQDMQPLGDIMAKWCVKAATGSPVVINFLQEAGLLSEDDLAKMTTDA